MGSVWRQVVGGVVLGLATAVQAQVAGTADAPAQTPAVVTQGVDTRWQASFDAFAEADKLQPPKPGGVLFVGSSSIRLWSDLEAQFGQIPITKRGFGGSRMSDCAAHVAELVLPYKPRLIVVYAGDNDLAEGRTPEQVRDSYRQFVERVRAALPATRIAYISVKPSPLRESLMPAVRQTNALIQTYTASVPNLDFIDVYSKMLDAEGRPRRDLFQPDALHMNAAGYAVWQTVIAGHLR